MSGMGLARRVAAGVFVASVFGCSSTFAPVPRAAEPTVAEVSAELPARPKPSRAPVVVKPPPPDCSRVACVALTFDDGPAESTRKLLNILESRKVRATFFLVGQNVKEYPELVRRERAAGHELADHSYTHADLGRASEQKIRRELRRTQKAIRQAAGTTPTLLRPPYGSTSERLKKVAREMGLAQILWSVDPQDWAHRDSGYIEKRVLKAVKAGDVVLLHDIHPTTVKAVPRIIDRLLARGFVFVTVSELFGGRFTPGKEYTRPDSGDGQGHP